jgi:hypothetical protein
MLEQLLLRVWGVADSVPSKKDEGAVNTKIYSKERGYESVAAFI